MDKEIDVWKDLRHPNILAFYGACSIADPPFMVCEYKANGNVVEYLRCCPDADRCQLVNGNFSSSGAIELIAFSSYSKRLSVLCIYIRTKLSTGTSKEYVFITLY